MMCFWHGLNFLFFRYCDYCYRFVCSHFFHAFVIISYWFLFFTFMSPATTAIEIRDDMTLIDTVTLPKYSENVIKSALTFLLFTVLWHMHSECVLASNKNKFQEKKLKTKCHTHNHHIVLINFFRLNAIKSITNISH